MADIAAFPTIRNAWESGANVISLTATNAIKAGQAVEIDATGVSGAVNAAVQEAGSQPVGVAIADADAGGKVAVATTGCVVYVANADDTAAIDAGSPLETNDNAVGGTVSAVTVTATGGATVTVHPYVVGIALDDIAGGGTGRMLVLITPQNVQANSS